MSAEKIEALDFDALDAIGRQCLATAEEHGWWEKYEGEDALKFFVEIIASKLMLTVSEEAEALEETRDDMDLKKVYYTRTTKEGNRTIIERSPVPTADINKPEGFGIELADAVIRIFDLAYKHDISLGEFIKMKMAYNESRPYKHGGKNL